MFLLRKSQNLFSIIVILTRFLRGEIDKVMLLAYPIWRISNAVRSPELLFVSFPVLAIATLLRKQVVEFGNILNELSYLIDQDVDKSGKNMWWKRKSNCELIFVFQKIEINLLLSIEAWSNSKLRNWRLIDSCRIVDWHFDSTIWHGMHDDPKDTVILCVVLFAFQDTHSRTETHISIDKSFLIIPNRYCYKNQQ